jgi:DNA helicase-2/ATP-dependent DNA helicase PcrA
MEPALYTNPRKLSRVENEKSDPANHQHIGDLHVGDTIRHERFGKGKVVALTGENENAKASVEFENFGNKQLLLKFAHFEILKK